MKRKSLEKLLLPLQLLGAVLLSSCGPAIKSFDVKPMIITAADTVKMTWSVKGTPTLLYHEKNISEDPDEQQNNLGTKYQEFTLVATKGNKEKSRPVQVVVLKDSSATDIVFRTDLKGDTLIAAGDKNAERWGDNFEVTNVASASGRSLTVKHENRSVILNRLGTPSTALKGTAVKGHWELSSLLTPAEKQDMSTAPDRLRIIVTIKYKRN